MAVSEGITIVFIGFTVIFASLALAIQVAIILWRKFHPRSFETVTFCALCWIPPIVAFMTSSWWFIIFLSIFFSISMLALFKAHQRPLLSSTPGVIFNWFYLVHNCSFLLWMIGSVTFVIGFFIGVSWLMNSGTLCTLNGVYFGLVGDDIAMHITDNLFLKSSVYHQDNVLPKYFDDPFCCSLCLGERVFCSVFRNCQKLLTTKAAKTAPVENKTVFIASRVLNERLFGCERNAIFVIGNKVLLKMNIFGKLFSSKLIELGLTRKNHLTFKDKT